MVFLSLPKKYATRENVFRNVLLLREIFNAGHGSNLRLLRIFTFVIVVKSNKTVRKKHSKSNNKIDVLHCNEFISLGALLLLQICSSHSYITLYITDWWYHFVGVVLHYVAFQLSKLILAYSSSAGDYHFSAIHLFTVCLHTLILDLD